MEHSQQIPLGGPRILTTTVGSYPPLDWIGLAPTEQSLIDATRVVFHTQRLAGVDLPTDGELYRFDPNHPDTNGMIDYFVTKMAGVSTRVGRSDWSAFSVTDRKIAVLALGRDKYLGLA